MEAVKFHDMLPATWKSSGVIHSERAGEYEIRCPSLNSKVVKSEAICEKERYSYKVLNE